MGPSVKFVSCINGSFSKKKIRGRGRFGKRPKDFWLILSQTNNILTHTQARDQLAMPFQGSLSWLGSMAEPRLPFWLGQKAKIWKIKSRIVTATKTTHFGHPLENRKIKQPMIDDGLFVAARCVENKTIKDFQRCISLHKQLQQSSSSCKSQLVFFHPQSRAKKIKLSLSDKTRTIHPANNYKWMVSNHCSQ